MGTVMSCCDQGDLYADGPEDMLSMGDGSLRRAEERRPLIDIKKKLTN